MFYLFFYIFCFFSFFFCSPSSLFFLYCIIDYTNILIFFSVSLYLVTLHNKKNSLNDSFDLSNLNIKIKQKIVTFSLYAYYVQLLKGGRTCECPLDRLSSTPRKKKFDDAWRSKNADCIRSSWFDETNSLTIDVNTPPYCSRV